MFTSVIACGNHHTVKIYLKMEGTFQGYSTSPIRIYKTHGQMAAVCDARESP